MLREQIYPSHLCWYFRKNTAWKYKFDIGLQRLVEAGLIVHWIQVLTSSRKNFHFFYLNIIFILDNRHQ